MPEQFVESDDLSNAVEDAVLSNQDSDNQMAEYYFANPRLQVELVRLLGQLVQENVRSQAS